MNVARRRSALALALALATLLAPAACSEFELTGGPSAADSTPLECPDSGLTPWPAQVRQVRFGVIPSLEKDTLENVFDPLLAYLSSRIGVPFELVIAADYDDLGQRMRAQEIDVGKFSPVAYVEARRADPGLGLLAMQIAEGSNSYLGYIYTRVDSGIDSLEELAGHSMCFVDPSSSSGYHYPRALLRQRGIDPDRHFSKVVFGGNHMACLRKVLDGELDAGTSFSAVIAAARREGQPLHRLEILGKTDRIPYDPYCVRSGLPEAAADRIAEELLALSTRSPEGRRVLGGFIRLNAWTKVDDAAYDSVRETLRLSRGRPMD